MLSQFKKHIDFSQNLWYICFVDVQQNISAWVRLCKKRTSGSFHLRGDYCASTTHEPRLRFLVRSFGYAPFLFIRNFLKKCKCCHNLKSILILVRICDIFVLLQKMNIF